MTIKDLEPKIVWNNFYELTRIPRPSKHEEKVIAFLVDWGKKHGFDTVKDETGNVIISVPATPGYENRRGVILQGHMDMVPQKTADSKHNFLTDPIETEIVGEWVGAKGTTLGADDGMGLAFAMAVLEDKTLKHGPVELLATYDEETGMSGAENLKPGMLKGDILINIDSEDEGELCIGCAGGLDAIADFKYRTYKAPEGMVGYKVGVKDLQGGHSGMDISLYRGNSNKIVADALIPVMEQFRVKVANFTGGSLRNAIPFEAEALILVPEAAEKEVVAAIKASLAEAKAEFAESDPNMQTYVRKVNAPARYIASGVMLRALKAVIVCPSNVIRMSQSMAGLTETSINLAIVRTERGHIKVACLLRSAVNAAKMELARRVKYVFEFAGADKIEFTGGYPGWLPKPDTPINKIMADVYRKMFGREMKVVATHGGLECAIMGATYPKWEMTSIGPTIVHPHSPDERVKISTVAEVWEFLKAVLEEIPCK